MISKKVRIKNEGLGENAAFYRSHPLINFIYFVAVIGVTMFSNHPLFLFASFTMAWFYSVLLKGKKAVRFNTIVMLPVILITVIINGLNVHEGVTVLFYLNGNAITKEAIMFGLVQGLMLTSVIIWFSCFSVIMTGDKFIYLFGRVAPVIALTLSMVLRFIPLLKNRFREISAAQRCMGRYGRRGVLYRIRQFGKEVSILIAWSLEASIESADSMEARGYGLKGRTSFHLFSLIGAERWILAFMLVLGCISILGCLMNYTNVYYYPTITIPPINFVQSGLLTVFFALMCFSVVIDIRGIKRWK